VVSSGYRHGYHLFPQEPTLGNFNLTESERTVALMSLLFNLRKHVCMTYDAMLVNSWVR
jgi:hypothetical protein